MKLIILDRDGVINQDSDAYIKSEEEWQPIPGSLEAIAELTRNGYQIVVTTNQSGINRNFYNHQTLNAMHNKLRRLLTPLGGRIHAIFYCPHIPDDKCQCRKPSPGLFQRVANFYQLSLDSIYSIGDSYRDLEAAIKVGSKPILVLTGKGISTFNKYENELNQLNIPVCKDLADAVSKIKNNLT